MRKEADIEPLANGEWEEYSLDVGQADGHVIITPKGTLALIDADKEAIVEALNDVLDGRIDTDTTNAVPIDHFVTTHIHDDHVAGIQALNDGGYAIQRAYRPSANRYDIGPDGGVDVNVLERYIDGLSDHGIDPDEIEPLTTGDMILREDDTTLKALSPPATGDDITFTRPSTGRTCSYRSEKANPNGVVCKLDGPAGSCLFMGDMANEAANNGLSWLIKQHDNAESDVNLNTTVLCVGHHGSSSATSEAFLDRVDPAVAIVSSSLTNSYTSENEYDGHPHDVTLQFLSERDIGVYWTAGHRMIRTNLDATRDPAPTTDLGTTNATDLAALKYYCRENETNLTSVDTLSPGHLPEEAPEWATDAAPIVAETSQEIVDAAITNAETVAEVRQTLAATPAAHEHLRELVQTDRNDHVPSEAVLERNRQRYRAAVQAHNAEPSLFERFLLRVPNRFGGIDPPTQNIPSPEEIEGPRTPSDIPAAAREDPAEYYRHVGLSPTDTQQAAEEQTNTAVATAETAGELCWGLRQTDGAHKECLHTIDTPPMAEDEPTTDHATTVTQETTHDLTHNDESGVGLQ